MYVPRVVISALRGSSGKTILTLSLAALWRKKGLRVTPFKKGPDYIDAGWLAKAAGGPCFNLDLFMMSPGNVVQSFVSHTNPPLPPFIPKTFGRRQRRIIAVIEGNRGLYDGVDTEGTYSTAELAKLLNAPVILIADCTKATGTVSATILGCQKLDPKVRIKGVILNNIATKRQELLIRKAVMKNCRIPVLGAIPKLKDDPFPERHMGLIPFQEHFNIKKSISKIAGIGAKYLDLNAILKIANEAGTIKSEIRNPKSEIDNSSLVLRPSSLKIGIIRDSAFQFYYPENFEELKKCGAKLIEISALKEKKLPALDALYIGGGFPETHAIALAKNVEFKKSLCKAIEDGLPVYAECGGLMYLGKSLILNNKTYPMTGVLPVVFGLEKKPQAHGYTIVEVKKENPYFPKGCILKGHEFHYSKVIDIKGIPKNNLPSPPFSKGGQGRFEKQKDNIYFAFTMKRGYGIKNGKDGLCYKNVLATYTHLHALGAKEWVDGLIRCAMEFRFYKRNLSLL